jgi:hypothetical protein
LCLRGIADDQHVYIIHAKLPIPQKKIEL